MAKTEGQTRNKRKMGTKTLEARRERLKKYYKQFRGGNNSHNR